MINTDAWSERFPAHPVVRALDPPRVVLVDVDRALPLSRGGQFRSDRVSMRVKIGGLRLTGTLPALHTHWLRIFDDQWVAAVTVQVSDSDESNRVEIDMLVTADAITEPPVPQKAP